MNEVDRQAKTMMEPIQQPEARRLMAAIAAGLHLKREARPPMAAAGLCLKLEARPCMFVAGICHQLRHPRAATTDGVATVALKPLLHALTAAVERAAFE